MNNKILFAKLKPQAQIPSKRVEDGAFDIYACFEEDWMTICPHETKMIPTGLASVFSSDYVAILKERGSTGTMGIGQRAGVVDSGYRGEWFVPITNHSPKTLVIAKPYVTFHQVTNQFGNGNIFTYDTLDSEGNLICQTHDYVVYPYTKAIAQCLMVEVPKFEIEEVSPEEISKYASERGAGKLGSSTK